VHFLHLLFVSIHIHVGTRSLSLYIVDLGGWVAQINIEAYLLWEKAGRPDGADLSGDARRVLEDQLRSGKSLEEIEKALKGPPAEAPPSSSNGNGSNGSNRSGALALPSTPSRARTHRGRGRKRAEGVKGASQEGGGSRMTEGCGLGTFAQTSGKLGTGLQKRQWPEGAWR
jgi:hypothetical protein